MTDLTENAVVRDRSEGADKAKILVVDDRPENLLVSRTLLDELGHEVITVRSGEEALKCLLEHDVAVILLDVNMPGMDGLETATYIRMRQKSVHTPIIFLTAYVEEMHTAKGYSLGAVDYILTPVMPEVLRTKVKVFVQLHLMTRQAQRQAEQRIALAREQAARVAAEETLRRAAFLADARDILGSSLDAPATIKALAQFLVPFLGDFCALTLIDERGHLKQMEIGWSGSEDGARGHCVSVIELDNPAITGAMQDALAAGSVAVVTELDAGHATLRVTRAAGDPPDILELGFSLRSLAVLPLIARGRKLGALVLGLRSSDRRFDAGTLTLAEDLATRAAVSLDNCLLYAKVQEADQRKNEFLAMLAHELRNPLAPVRNAVQILRMAKQDPERLNWGIDVIDRQTKQLARLVDDLLDVARITQGKIDLKLEAVDVSAVVSLAMEMNRQLVDKHQYNVTVTVPPTPLFVHGDYSRVAQILSNLMNNALKYTEPGGNIALSAEESGAEVIFRVKDTGIGIPEDMLGSIFELFTQADRSLDRSQGGLGIGLTIVRRLVSMHGGSIEAYSDGPQKGSEFVVRLPRAAGHNARDSEPAATTVTTASNPAHRVLVVDDYADAAESMAALLRVQGQEVRIAHDGETALDIARSFKPSVVFLDIGLPRMNGFEVVRALRAMPETQDCRVVAISGYGQPDDLRRSREAGFDRHLVKPVDLLALGEILDSMNNSRHARAQTSSPLVGED